MDLHLVGDVTGAVDVEEGCDDQTIVAGRTGLRVR